MKYKPGVSPKGKETHRMKQNNIEGEEQSRIGFEQLEE